MIGRRDTKYIVPIKIMATLKSNNSCSRQAECDKIRDNSIAIPVGPSESDYKLHPKRH